MNERFYLLKIQLLDIEPAIWRRFVVPASITLDRFHDVIQIVMGWTDSHLHQFTIGSKRYTEYPESKEEGLVCGRYRLGNLIKQKGRTFRYLYDFGDSWEHELVLEESRYFNPELRTELACFEGERACPPEDVGGVPGYFEFCNALKDPSHEEHEGYMEWSGGDYDSDRFDSGSINWELMKYLRYTMDDERLKNDYTGVFEILQRGLWQNINFLNTEFVVQTIINSIDDQRQL
ncbi:plasmid pRiA4b ORF-3 family protein [uncultured Desulfobacter sp.]|uniref:plasmid pRiA4b ORF-3 family protein n=1 Tax=uncultured Desulfobacter sp. TaxID=240139 RepID=UPI0029F58811|nr:plasmid pRiA4b ORF-3 family protein [uncultured Desulfobacter sp.]